MDSGRVVNLLSNIYNKIIRGPVDLVQGRLKFLSEILDAWDEENRNFNKQKIKTEYLDECGPNEESSCDILIHNIMSNCSEADNKFSLILGTVSEKKQAMNSFSKNAIYKHSSTITSNGSSLEENSLMDSFNGGNEEAVDLSLVDQSLPTEYVNEIGAIETSDVNLELGMALENSIADIVQHETTVKKRGRPRSNGKSILVRPAGITKESRHSTTARRKSGSGLSARTSKKPGSKQGARSNKKIELSDCKIMLQKNSLNLKESVEPRRAKRVKKVTVDFDSLTEENSEFESGNENSDADDNVQADPDFEIKTAEVEDEAKREQKTKRSGNNVSKPRKKRVEKGEKQEKNPKEKKPRKKREKKKKVETDQDKEILCCEHCGKFLPSQTALALHKQRHVGLASKPCQVCGKEFTLNCNLLRHLKAVHGQGTVKKFSCDVCGKAFGRSDHLTLHKRFHTGEKPYLCTICGKGFFDSPHLKKHLFMHRGYKPYKCTLCSNQYVNKATLQQHTVSVHGINLSGEEVDVKALLPTAKINEPVAGDVRFSWRYELCPIGKGGL